ncbi:MAG: ATP-binding protein [Pseudomonadota bacterium]
MDRLAPFILFLLLLASNAWSQESFLKQEHWLLDQFDLDDGLPVNGVNALAWGPEGYLWIATFDGLARFDGEQFVVFDRASNPELPGNRFVRMLWSHGYLWIETADQRLVRMSSPGQFELVDESLGLPHPQVGRLLATDWALYVGTLAGVAKLRSDGTFEPFVESFTGPVQSLAHWPNEGLAAGTKNGQLVLLKEGQPPRSLPMPRGLGGISSLAYFEGLMAVGASGGAALLDRTGIQNFYAVEQGPMESVRVIAAEDRLLAFAYPNQLRWEKDRWVRTGSMPRHPIDAGAMVMQSPDGAWWNNHLYELERNGRTVFETDSIISDFVSSADGHAWIATNGAGLFRLRPRPVMNVGQEQGLINDNLYAVAQENDRLLAGSVDPVAYQVSLSGPDVVVDPLEAEDGYYTFLTDSQGNRWRAGARICVVAQGQDDCRNIDSLTNVQRHQFVYALLEDSEGNMWVGAEQSLALRDETNLWRLVELPWEKLEVGFRTGLETPDGTVWFGSSGGGIVLFDEGVATRVIDSSAGLSSNRIRSLHFDAESSSVWAGTEDGGICRIRSWQFAPDIRCISTRQGLWSDGVHKMLDDSQGRLWMSSNDGLFYATKSSLNAVADGTADWLLGMAFDESDGMANREANGGGQSAGVKTDDGWLWFPTQEGLAGLKPANVAAPSDTRVRIDGIIYDSVPQQITPTFEVQPENRNLEVRYSAASFGNRKRIRYRYRLGGPGSAWLEAGQRTFASLTSLPAGTVVFEVEASGEDGGWSGERDRLTLQVLPHLHETLGFRIFLALLVTSLILTAAWWRIRQLSVRQRELQLAVDERTSELSKAVDQISRQKDEIEASAKSRTRLFGSISHELRTPLSLILGPLEERSRRRRPVTAEDESMMLRNARRLSRMVDQILDLERVESGVIALNLEPVSCGALVRAVAEPFSQLAADKCLAWKLDISNGCPVLGDREQLEKVFSNLFSNAVKYTPKGGQIQVSCCTSDGRVLISVEDSGPGIAEPDRAEAFARFSRLKRDAHEPGTGIGLSLVQELVELHQGSVSIRSSEALGGAKLLLDFPAVDPLSEPPVAPTGQRKVLVVDDNPELRTYVASILDESFVVLQAVGGVEGLKLAREELPDVLVTDVMMPDLDGMAMVAELRQGGDEAAIPVVFLTARGGANDEIAALAAGGDQFLAKPFDSEVLLARVNAVMASADRVRDRSLPKCPECGQESKPEARPELEQRIRGIVMEHLDDPELSVSSIASALGMSRSNLFRQVKSELQTTPTLLMRRIRLEVARAWLDDMDLSISEIGYGAGFSSLSSFGRAFREQYGISASAYRQRQSAPRAEADEADAGTV